MSFFLEFFFKIIFSNAFFSLFAYNKFQLWWIRFWRQFWPILTSICLIYCLILRQFRARVSAHKKINFYFQPKRFHWLSLIFRHLITLFKLIRHIDHFFDTLRPNAIQGNLRYRILASSGHCTVYHTCRVWFWYTATYRSLTKRWVPNSVITHNLHSKQQWVMTLELNVIKSTNQSS